MYIAVFRFFKIMSYKNPLLLFSGSDAVPYDWQNKLLSGLMLKMKKMA